jgi:FtsH-binding integral membrane protein
LGVIIPQRIRLAESLTEESHWQKILGLEQKLKHFLITAKMLKGVSWTGLQAEKETRSMGGFCLVVLLLLISPRLFLIAVWLLTNWYSAFDSSLVAFLGWLFLP